LHNLAYDITADMLVALEDVGDVVRVPEQAEGQQLGSWGYLVEGPITS
jgi:hypothetical protein